MDHLNTVKKRLAEMGIDITTVKNLEWNYLSKIQAIIDDAEQEQEQALATLRNSPINKARIANDLGISRNTLYRYTLISDYIVDAKQRLDHNNPYIQVDQIKGELETKKQQIDKMIARDIQIEILKIQIKELEENIANLTARNQAYQQELLNAHNLISDYKCKQNACSEHSVVGFPKNN